MCLLQQKSIKSFPEDFPVGSSKVLYCAAIVCMWVWMAAVQKQWSHSVNDGLRLLYNACTVDSMQIVYRLHIDCAWMAAMLKQQFHYFNEGLR